MCLILLAFDAHPKYKFILAANRDEFYARPTAAAKFWDDAPQILAGRDLLAGGTWLGITKMGRFSAVTNYRNPAVPSGERSRGDLTRNFLNGIDSPKHYLQQIEREKEFFSGFNLLVGDFGKTRNELFYFSNRGGKTTKLSGGIYGLSNALLDSPWQKVENGKANLGRILQTNYTISADELFEILADRQVASDDKLPETGIGLERERMLSSAFIETKDYGTSISTVLLIDRKGIVQFFEKTHIGTLQTVNYAFTIDVQI